MTENLEGKSDGAIDVAVAIVEHHDHVLIGRRSSSGPQPGLWEFPGGKIERGESSQEAVMRECVEETGLAVSVLNRRLSVTHRYDDAFVRLHFFDCAINGANASPLAPFQWVSKDRLCDYSFPKANDVILSQITSG